jgi:hypothetical protein
MVVIDSVECRNGFTSAARKLDEARRKIPVAVGDPRMELHVRKLMTV